MANCHRASSWTVLPAGDRTGTLSCGAYRGRYRTSRIGVVQIIWAEGGGPKPGRDYGATERAALAACAKAEGV